MAATMQQYMVETVNDKVTPIKDRVTAIEMASAYHTAQIDALLRENKRLKDENAHQQELIDATREIHSEDKERIFAMIKESRDMTKDDVFMMCKRLDLFYRFAGRVTQSTQTTNPPHDNQALRRVARRLYDDTPPFRYTPTDTFSIHNSREVQNAVFHRSWARQQMADQNKAMQELHRDLDQKVIPGAPFQLNTPTFVLPHNMPLFNQLKSEQPQSPEQYLDEPDTPPHSPRLNESAESWVTVDVKVENGTEPIFKFPEDVNPEATARGESFWTEPSEDESELSFSSQLGDGSAGCEPGVTNKPTPSLSNPNQQVSTSSSMESLEDEVQKLLLKSKNPKVCERCGCKESIETLATMATPPSIDYFKHPHQWVGFQGNLPVIHLCPDRAQKRKRVRDATFVGPSSSEQPTYSATNGRAASQ